MKCRVKTDIEDGFKRKQDLSKEEYSNMKLGIVGC